MGIDEEKADYHLPKLKTAANTMAAVTTTTAGMMYWATQGMRPSPANMRAASRAGAGFSVLGAAAGFMHEFRNSEQRGRLQKGVEASTYTVLDAIEPPYLGVPDMAAGWRDHGTMNGPLDAGFHSVAKWVSKATRPDWVRPGWTAPPHYGRRTAEAPSPSGPRTGPVSEMELATMTPIEQVVRSKTGRR